MGAVDGLPRILALSQWERSPRAHAGSAMTRRLTLLAAFALGAAAAAAATSLVLHNLRDAERLIEWRGRRIS